MKAVKSDVVAIPARHIETFARRAAEKKQIQWRPAIAPTPKSAAAVRAGGTRSRREARSATSAAPIAASPVRHTTTAGAASEIH